jgi:heme-degrading monooxygenase HmoA
VPAGEPSVLRLFGFRPLGFGADYDARLRRTLLPAFLRLPGLRDAYVGRRGPEDSGERVIVSIWESADTMTAALGAVGEAPRGIEAAEEVGPSKVEFVLLAVDLPFDRPDPAQVLRVFRGQVRDGELDQYVEEARNGTLADAAGPHGPLGLYLGPQPPDRFVTVSVWTDWESIEAATHGNIRRPIATSNAARLVGGTATHFEVVPGAAHRPTAESPAGE